jgi:two-component system, chemotaxis family, chemotaxis protein CheY
MRKDLADDLLEGLDILLVDGNAYMRRLTRSMLISLGARSVAEAADGIAALEAIRTGDPDVMLLDWDVPLLNGLEVMRIVRSPGAFPRPSIPVIMLTNRGSHSEVMQAMHAGMHEFLIKPTSPKALRDRLTSILIKPRPMKQVGKFYGPEPRPKLAEAKVDAALRRAPLRVAESRRASRGCR